MGNVINILPAGYNFFLVPILDCVNLGAQVHLIISIRPAAELNISPGHGNNQYNVVLANFATGIPQPKMGIKK